MMRAKPLLLPLLVLALACAPERDPLDEIRGLQAVGRLGETVDPLRELVEEDPARAEPQLLLGRALLGTGEAGLAVWPLRRAAEAPEYAVEAGLLLAQAMLQSRTAPDAVAVLDHVIELEPENVDALVLRMQAHLASGALEEGLADIERVLEIDPDHLPVLAPRVTTLIALGRIEEAEEALLAAGSRIDAEATRVDPEVRARLCIARGLFALEDGRQEEAEALYDACLEEFPDDALTVVESVAFLDRIGRSERATELLEEAAGGEGGRAYFKMALANRMGMLHRPEEQERLVREVAEEVDSASGWFALADYYVQRERWDEAIDAFEASIDATPSPSPMLRFAYADTLVQAGRLDEAREAGERIEQPVFRDLIRGRVLLEEGRAREALDAFESGIRLWPNNAAGRFLAGSAAEQLLDFDRATAEYRESVRANAAETTAGLHLARLYAAHGDASSALGAIQRYVQTHPSDPAGIEVAIRIAHDAGRHAVAAEGLERLGALRGARPRAAAVEADLLAAGRGPELAAQAIEDAGLDLRAPENEVALAGLLAHLAAQGAHDRAVRLAGEAAEAHPQHAGFHALRGRALLAADAPKARVREAFERALELEPERGDALAALAGLAAAAGDPDAALALYDRAAASEPEEPAHPLAAARLAMETGRLGDAERRFEVLLRRHPREAGAIGDLARILAGRGELDRAEELAACAAWLRWPEAAATQAWIRALRERRAS